jgi:hypothetical protein
MIAFVINLKCNKFGVADRLGQKVAALRRERLAAEARLANREEERRRRRERVRAQQQLALERRNTLLQTLESLKRDLQVCITVVTAKCRNCNVN